MYVNYQDMIIKQCASGKKSLVCMYPAGQIKVAKNLLDAILMACSIFSQLASTQATADGAGS